MKGQTNPWLRTPRARELRHNLTDAERLLWRHLRGNSLGAKFRRQHPFEDFVLDFVSPEARLVVELDGGQHAARSTADAARTRALAIAGFRVPRFWNNEVLGELDAVLGRIAEALRTAPSNPPQSTGTPPCPSPNP